MTDDTNKAGAEPEGKASPDAYTQTFDHQAYGQHRARLHQATLPFPDQQPETD